MGREKMDTSADIREMERSVDSLAMTPPDAWGSEEITKTEVPKKSVPPGVRSLVTVLELLPPDARLLGLALILAAVGVFVAWKGGF